MADETFTPDVESILNASALEKMDVLAQKLETLIRPFVEPVVRQRLAEETANPPLSDDELESVKALLASEEMKALLASEEMKALLATGANDASSGDDLQSFDELVNKEEIAYACQELIRVWLDVLILSVLDQANQIAPLSAASLDDAMLPPLDGKMAETFEVSCNYVFPDVRSARDILRAVKRSLPAGQVLPEAAVELLKLHGVTVV